MSNVPAQPPSSLLFMNISYCLMLLFVLLASFWNRNTHLIQCNAFIGSSCLFACSCLCTVIRLWFVSKTRFKAANAFAGLDALKPILYIISKRENLVIDGI